MILDFSVSNYRSIKEVQSLSMMAAPIVSKNKELDTLNVMDLGKWQVLKSKAIYGANASGKSNIIRALLVLIRLVNDSVKDDTLLGKQIERFALSAECDHLPSFFQLMFVVEGVSYRYGFEATDEKIVSEWLFGTPGKKEVVFFIRDENEIKINEKHFAEGSKLKSLVRSNALFLTVAKSLNGYVSGKLIRYISGIIVISGLGDKRLIDSASEAIEDAATKQKIVEMLRMADVGIDDLAKVEVDVSHHSLHTEIPDTPSVKALVITDHKKWNANNEQINSVGLSLEQSESEGTKKMFELSPVIFTALEQQRPLVMDEFDARFHPLLSRKLVELFNSTTNDKKTQFIFATHDTNLLQADLLRRDQICFAEKDKKGASHFYSLADFKGVRNDASFEKDYIMGKYGAIPFIGDFQTLFDHA